MPAVVIDIGSGLTKAGFGGQDAPSVVFPSVVGIRRHQHDMSNPYMGQEALDKRGILSIKYPVEYGRIHNWDGMEAIWNHIFTNELKVDPGECPVFLTESVIYARACREKTVQVMFERFNVPAVYLGVDAVMSLYAEGRTTGMVVQSGQATMAAVPIIESRVQREAALSENLGGREVTQSLMKAFSLTTSAEQYIARDMKAKFCYVALDFEQEMKKATSSLVKTYELPDGKILTIDNERFKCPEAIFNPALIGKESSGLHELVHRSIQKCDASVREVLYTHMVLAGGSTMLPGLADRLQKDVAALAPSPVKVTAPSNRHISSWVGASRFTDQPSFSTELAISKKEYEEVGPSIVSTKCP